MPTPDAEPTTGTVLDEIVAHKRQELGARKQLRTLEQLKAATMLCAKRFHNALKTSDGINLIAEIKPKSPSGGDLSPALDLASVLSAYDRYAAAISVLTDRKYFGGDIETLQAVASKVNKPVLCKEFIIDPYQIYEACNVGAAAVLLIVKILDDDTLAALKSLADQLHMDSVIEIQSADELQRALKVKPEIVLINNRNLATFEISLETTEQLSPLVPAGITVIAASGIDRRADIDRLLPFTNNFLVGSALMRAENIEEKLKELCAT
jgi:indole-3-glycerol phosphate synthase/phosphoribosylanthranilate isomerase